MRLTDRTPAWVPLALGVGATVAAVWTLVWPALAAAARFDEERVRLERTVASLRADESARRIPSGELRAERDRLRAAVQARLRAIGDPLPIAWDAEGTATIAGDLAAVLTALGAIESDPRIVAGQITIEPASGDGQLRLAVRARPAPQRVSAEEEQP
jgi:hypothetical protein